MLFFFLNFRCIFVGIVSCVQLLLNMNDRYVAVLILIRFGKEKKSKNYNTFIAYIFEACNQWNVTLILLLKLCTNQCQINIHEYS